MYGLESVDDVESDKDSDDNEEGVSKQHVQREGELGLAHVVPVAEQPGVVEAKAAQVVERGEVEGPAEAAPLREADRPAERKLAAADDAEGLDRVGLQIGIERILPALWQRADAD